MDFSSAHPTLAAALVARGYTAPTPVQAAMFGPEVAGRDLLVSAQTGSGKTVAFGLAMAAELFGDQPGLPPPGAPLALVVAPTRELALQVRRELAWLYAGARVTSCVGGMAIRTEQRALASGCHIVVGTPGRLCDHLNQKALDLSGIRVLVLDEADEMLDMGFRDELEVILAATPRERRGLFFSATLPAGIQRLASAFLKDPLRIAASPPDQAHADIEYRAVTVLPHEREAAIVNLLRFFQLTGAVVFCATREGVEHVRSRLVERGFPAVSISGDLTQVERTRALDSLRSGRAAVLVATDVAARGLDLPDLGLVIQADLPHDAQILQHRSGRTGRAGRKGVSVLLVPPARRRMAERLYHEAGVEPRWSRAPSVEAIEALDRDRILATVGELAAELDDAERAAGAALLAAHGPEALAGIVHHLLQARLPSPEVLPETDAFLARLSEPRVMPRRDVPSSEPPRASPRPPPARPLIRPPEDVPASGPGATRSVEVRAVRPPPDRGGVWFRVSVGRAQQADPRWLVPLLCRRGRIVKEDIGAIRIFDGETRVEINPQVARQFAELTRKATGRDAGVEIVPV